MKISKTVVASVVLAAALSACGGGGGSPGETHGAYNVTLTADRTLLPLNTGNQTPGIGVYAPFTTTVYVNATENGSPIPGSGDDDDKTFGCNIEGGLNTGSLYYLDGKDEHMTEVDDGKGGKIKVPSAYRSITLGANSGGNSFHFHAGNQAGTATITCSAQNPQDKKNYSASVTITVGAASGKIASVTGIAQSNTLGTQGNTANTLPTSTNITVRVLDDANQVIPNPAKQNLQVSIRSSTGAGAGARLMAGGQTTGSTLWLSTIAGVGNFNLSSGLADGSIVLDMTGDRSDNDVTNGIQDPIVGVLVVQATSKPETSSTTPPSITTTSITGTATVGIPFGFVLEASGGVSPYSWTALGSLPAGLTLSSAGVISGTPSSAGAASFAVRVTDSAGNSDQANYSLTVAAAPVVPTVPTPTPALAVGGCSGSTCTLPVATKGLGDYSYTFWATGGTGATTTWSLGGAIPTGMTLDPATGKLTWLAANVGCPNPRTITVSVTRGTETANQTVTLPVKDTGGATCP